MDILPKDISLIIEKDKITYTKKINGLPQLVEKKYSLNSSQIREELLKNKFSAFYNSIGGRSARDEALENLKMPPIAYIYYYLFAELLRIPTVEEVCKKYLTCYCESTGKSTYEYRLKETYVIDKNHDFVINHLYGRICRAYNSFNREIELLSQLVRFNDLNSFYSIQSDFYDGIDIVIEYDNKIFGLASYINSSKSLAQRKMKERYRHNYSNFYILPVVARFSVDENGPANILKWNDVYIYNDDVSTQIYDAITKNSDSFTPIEIDNPICPQCGAIMTKRVAKKSQYLGREFWGCSNWPNCNKIVSI